MQFARPVLYIMILFSIVSCTKNDLPSANGKRIAKIVDRWHDSLYNIFFKYDQDGRVIGLIGNNPPNNPFDTMFISIDYNSEGKILNHRTRYTNGSFLYDFTFIYDANGRIREQRYLPTNGRVKSYGYDQEGRLVIDSNFIFSLNACIPWGVYEYNSSGDVVKWLYQTYNPYKQKIDTSLVAEATYHNTENSLAHLREIFYHVLKYSPYILSKHNVAQIKYSNYTTTFNYEYYAGGQIKKIIFDNDKEYYVEFIYE